VSQPKRRAAVVFVLVTLLLDAVGFGIVVPILPELIRQLGHVDVGAASVLVGWLIATFALAQLVAAPLLGALSDRVGRRPVILLSCAGIAANYLLLAWAPSLAWLFVGRLLAGITAANAPAASAYIADVTPPEERARRFGLLGAMFGVGFVLGPAFGGMLGDIHIRLPFLASAGLAGANALYGLLVLPESLPRDRRVPFSWRAADPVSGLRLLAADPMLRRLGLAWASLWFSLGAIQSVFVLSNTLRFGWGPGQNGLVLALSGLSGAVVQGLLVRRIIGWLGERRTAMAANLASARGFLFYAFAWWPWMIFVGIVAQAFGAMAYPSLRALISARAGPLRQGRAMGALSSVEGLTAIFGPLFASMLFLQFAGSAAAPNFPGAPFLAGAGVYFIALVAVRGVRVELRRPTA
jgi:DHA1 family tetracycline resistance protein-like MFS transporter